MLKRLKRAYEKLEFDRVKNNISATWDVIKKVAEINSKNSSATELLSLHSTPEDSVNEVNKYFSQIGCRLAQSIGSGPNLNAREFNGGNERTSNSFGLIPVDQGEVLNIITHLKNNCSVGWDGIHTNVIKSSASVCSSHCTYL